MIDSEFDHAQRIPFFLDGAVQTLFRIVRCVFFPQYLDGLSLFRIVFYKPGISEDDYAAEVGGVFFRDDLVLVDYTKGYLAAVFDRIDLVAAFRGVKIDFAVTVYIAERNRIGLSVVSGHG